MTPTTWLVVLAFAFDLLNLIAIILFFRKPSEFRRAYWPFVLLMILSLSSDMICMIGGLILRYNMNIVIVIANILSCPLLLLLYKKKMSSIQIGYILSITLVAFVMFGLVNLYSIQGVRVLNSYTMALGALILIFTSIGYFFYLLKYELSSSDIAVLPMFWINSAVLLLYSGTFFIFIFTTYFLDLSKSTGYSTFIKAFMVHHVLQIIFYALVIVGLRVTNNSERHSLYGDSVN